LRRTLTHDNGTEFADHHKLRDALGIMTYFCNPHSPWEKGGIEDRNGRLRRELPRKTDITQRAASVRGRRHGVQQHPAQVSWLQNTQRGISRPTVALQM
jgi:IS30 family transposase